MGQKVYSMDNWSKLSLREKRQLMNVFLDGGVYELDTMKKLYNNRYDDGGYKPSEKIKNYIKKIEGFRKDWYNDTSGVKTVGYGFTGKDFQQRYPNGMTREQADAEFEKTIRRFAGYVESLTPNFDKLSQNQKDALLSYVYNVGPGNFKNSSKLQAALANQDWQTAAQHMNIGYNDSRAPGLKRRRDYERSLFLGYEYLDNGQSDNQSSDNQSSDYWKSQYMKMLGAFTPAQTAEAPTYFTPRYEEKLFSSNTPLSDFTPISHYNNPIEQTPRRKQVVTQEQPSTSEISTSTDILNNMFANINAIGEGNLFVTGGDGDGVDETDPNFVGPVLPTYTAPMGAASISASLPSVQTSHGKRIARNMAQRIVNGKMTMNEVPRSYRSYVEGEVKGAIPMTDFMNKAGKYVAAGTAATLAAPWLISGATMLPGAATYFADAVGNSTVGSWVGQGLNVLTNPMAAKTTLGTAIGVGADAAGFVSGVTNLGKDATRAIKGEYNYSDLPSTFFDIIGTVPGSSMLTNSSNWRLAANTARNDAITAARNAAQTPMGKRAAEVVMRQSPSHERSLSNVLFGMEGGKNGLLYNKRFVFTGNRDAARFGQYNGLTNDAQATGIPSTADPISTYLYETELDPRIARRVTPDYGIHRDYVAEFYGDKNVPVYEAGDYNNEFEHEISKRSPFRYPVGVEGGINTREPINGRVDVAGHFLVPVEFDKTGYATKAYQQDIWKYLSKDWFKKYTESNKRPSLFQEIGVNFIDAAGTPIIFRSKVGDTSFYRNNLLQK